MSSKYAELLPEVLTGRFRLSYPPLDSISRRLIGIQLIGPGIMWEVEYVECADGRTRATIEAADSLGAREYTSDAPSSAVATLTLLDDLGEPVTKFACLAQVEGYDVEVRGDAKAVVYTAHLVTREPGSPYDED